MRLMLLLLPLFMLPALPAAAQKAPVDLELAFVVDASGSIDPAETELQRRGYAQALAHPRVLKAISAGFLQRIAVAFIEFAAESCERVGVPWMVIDGPASAAEFGKRLAALDYGFCPGGNAVADAIAFAARSIEENGFEGTRRVIDISGDGPNTLGLTLSEVRSAVVARDITINALVLDRPEMPDLPEYFRRYVIGGPGAFAIDANDHATFAEAILKKMLSEIVEAPPADVFAMDQRAGITRSDFLRSTGTTSYRGMR